MSNQRTKQISEILLGEREAKSVTNLGAQVTMGKVVVF